MVRLGILNYGMGNLSSVMKSFVEVVEHPSVVLSPAELKSIDALVLPGVGHFGAAMRYLSANGFLPYLQSTIRDGLPTLGICLGFQLLCEYSEEDLSVKGLGLFPLGVSRLGSQHETKLKIPQIGWNTVNPFIGKSILFNELPLDERVFYFANSFGVKVRDSSMVSTSYFHGDQYLASVESSKVFGVQFHPEKSHNQGRQVLKNFISAI